MVKQRYEKKYVLEDKVKEKRIKEKVEDKKQVQVRILRRFMSEKDIEKMLTEYRSNFKGGIKDRTILLNQPLKRNEKVALQRYFFETDKMEKDIAVELGMKAPGMVRAGASRAAIKIVYQNQDKLNLKKILGGGE